MPNFLAHPRRAPSLACFSFACSISAQPEKGKESAATQVSVCTFGDLVAVRSSTGGPSSWCESCDFYLSFYLYAHVQQDMR